MTTAKEVLDHTIQMRLGPDSIFKVYEMWLNDVLAFQSVVVIDVEAMVNGDVVVHFINKSEEDDEE